MGDLIDARDLFLAKILKRAQEIMDERDAARMAFTDFFAEKEMERIDQDIMKDIERDIEPDIF